MRLRSLTRRRPSASIILSSAALFMSLGGVGYAATGMIGTDQIKNDAVTFQKIRPNSVGRVRLANGGVINSKIANGAVSFRKIQPNAVGTRRANLNQLQARVTGTCPAGTAVAAIDNKGDASCNSVLPTEYAAPSATATLTGAAAAVSSLTLPAGQTYLAFGNTEIAAASTDTAQRLTATCILTVGATTQSRSVALRTDGTAGDVATASLPLQAAGTAGASSIQCSAAVPTGATLPKVTATSTINALATAAND